MKTLRRVTTAAAVSALLAIGGAGAAQADVSFPSGGTWYHGTTSNAVYSNFYHGYRYHGSTAVGAWTSRSPIVRPGNWSWAWAARKLWGNRAYYRFS